MFSLCENNLIMNNVIESKSFAFAVRIVNLTRQLSNDRRNYVLANQLLRSGTSIGANISEAQQAQSKADFISKMNIALKETSETKYWLKLLNATGYIEDDFFTSIINDCTEIERILTSIIKSSKSKTK